MTLVILIGKCAMIERPEAWRSPTSWSFAQCPALELRYYDDVVDRELGPFIGIFGKGCPVGLENQEYERLAAEGDEDDCRADGHHRKIDRLKVRRTVYYAKIYLAGPEAVPRQGLGGSIRKKLDIASTPMNALPRDRNQTHGLLELTS